MHGSSSSSEVCGSEWGWMIGGGPPSVLEIDLGAPDALAGREAIDRCLAVLAREDVPTLDVRGAPAEAHPQFLELAILARALRCRVLVRATLEAFSRPLAASLPERLFEHGIDLVAAMPWGPHDAADGPLVTASLDGLERLCHAGYGGGQGPRLDLCAWRPGTTDDGGALERGWREALAVRGIRFHRLHVLGKVSATPAHGLANHLASLVRGVPAVAVVGWGGALTRPDGAPTGSPPQP